MTTSSRSPLLTTRSGSGTTRYELQLIFFYYYQDLCLFPFFLVQITETLSEAGQKQTTLVEIGPRFVLSLMRIFGGSFGGPTLYQNKEFISPNEVRREMRKQEAEKQANRKQDAKDKAVRRAAIEPPVDELDTMFD